jgi:zinc protease
MKGRIFFVDVPGAAQSQVQLMHFGPLRTAPDYMATTLMSSILGGGFSSRLNMNLREDKGYSYGARGGFGYTRFFGTFGAGASVRTDATYQTVLEIVHEVSALATAKTPPTAAELDREKTGAILGLPGRFATSSAALQAFRGLVYFGLPLDYYASYVAKMGKVDAAQVAKAAKAHLKPGDAVFLVVGDGSAPVKVRNGKTDEPLLKDGQPVTLRQALADLAASGDLGKGALVVLDADGKPVP